METTFLLLPPGSGKSLVTIFSNSPVLVLSSTLLYCRIRKRMGALLIVVAHSTLGYRVLLGAVLKKIKFLGYKDPGLKVCPLKVRGCPVVVLAGEGVTP